MKIFAIQKTPISTYLLQYQQNNSVSQNPATKTNIAGDKFVSNKISFSGGKSLSMLENELAELNKKLKLKQLTEEAYEKLARPLRDEIYQLKTDLGMIDASDPPPIGPTWD